MKIKIIALGKVKEQYLKDGIAEYKKRLIPYCPIEIQELQPIEIKDSALTKRILDKEGELILSYIKKEDYVITLEINGTEFSSEKFADKIKTIANDGISDIVFVIGSSCGLSGNVSKRANFKMSLSRMTYLHQIARFILLEQLYRTFKILNNEKYHK